MNTLYMLLNEKQAIKDLRSEFMLSHSLENYSQLGRQGKEKEGLKCFNRQFVCRGWKKEFLLSYRNLKPFSCINIMDNS